MGSDDTILVIFGITGDLAQRKLLPALRTLTHENLLPAAAKIIGVSRRAVEPVTLLRQTFGEQAAADPAVAALAERLSIFTMDVAKPDDYHRLKTHLAAISQQLSAPQVIFYLSVPPQATVPIVSCLGAAGLNDKRSVKVLLEKPFGVDLPSAEEAIAATARYFDESQLYRIDHYLAKEMAQNIVAFRSYNALFKSVWDASHIDHIDIVASEKIGIEGRAAFYEQTGALRDFLQNHLLQLLALTLMDIPPGFKPEDLPAARLQALEAIIPPQSDAFGHHVRRAQYAGYCQEVQNPGSQTETFVGMTLHSGQERWRDVPMRLATGKNLARQTTEIRVYFRKQDESEANLLVLHVQPNEAISITLWAKKAGYDKAYEQIDLAFAYKQPDAKTVEAYERVLLDAIASDKSLFTTADEVLASWRILQPVQHHWAMHTADIETYKPGTDIDALLSNR
jgi:glucose-6-phosphate 1-dehydrogenase